MSELRVFIIAGEASGDACGAKLMSAMKKKHDSKIVFSGVGGIDMSKEGLCSIFSMSDIAVMGIVELLPKLLLILKRISFTAEKLREFNPDVIITIDSPDFCFRVVNKVADLRNKGTKFVHYVSPSVWAYKPGRVQKMAKNYDLVLALLPFEPAYYEGSGLRCEYVGHHLVENDWAKASGERFRKRYKIAKDKKILGVFSGSRESEVEMMLPIFIEAINLLGRDVLVVYPAVSEKIAGVIERCNAKANFEYKVVLVQGQQEKLDMMASFYGALVKSGTSSLELVFAKVPMIVAYKMHWLTAFIGGKIFRILDRIKFVSIANLVLNKEVIPEFLQDKCMPESLSSGLQNIFKPDFRKGQIKEYEVVIKTLSGSVKIKPSQKAADEVLSF